MRSFNTLNAFPFDQALRDHQAIMLVAQSAWLSIAPSQLSQLCQAKSIQNQQLKLVTESSSAAAKIKLLTPSLLLHLQKQGIEVTSIQVKVQVKSQAPVPPKTQKVMSTKTVATLQSCAKQFDGTALGTALARLASHADIST